MSEEFRFSDDDDLILFMVPEWKPTEEEVESSRHGSQLDGRKFYAFFYHTVLPSTLSTGLVNFPYGKQTKEREESCILKVGNEENSIHHNIRTCKQRRKWLFGNNCL